MYSITTSSTGEATPCPRKMCRFYESKIHHKGNPLRHMQEPRWGAIFSIQNLKAKLLLANHKDGLHGIHLQMRQVPMICTNIESSSGGTYIHDQPVAICRMEN